MKKLLICMLILLLSLSLVGCTKAVEGKGPEFKQDATKEDEVRETAQDDQAAVEKLVKEFGSKLQMVSLLAPEDILAKSLQENYGDLISPELLKQWVKDPIHAPGRLTSSPWPERIEILRIEKLPEDRYQVDGEVIEITSTEQGTEKAAAKKPITLVVEKAEKGWTISAATVNEDVQ